MLRYLPTNLSAPEIARELSVSVNTVRTHIRHVCGKLGAHGRTEAVTQARALGLLAPSHGLPFLTTLSRRCSSATPGLRQARGPDLGDPQPASRGAQGDPGGRAALPGSGGSWGDQGSPPRLTEPPRLVEPLSQGETRVLRYLPTNLSAPEIARELSVSVNTVRTHIRHVCAKLGAHGRTEAVTRARGLGLLAPSGRTT